MRRDLGWALASLIVPLSAETSAERLLGAAIHLRDALAAAKFPLEASDAERASDDVRAALDQLEDHVLPRLAALDSPALVVIGGSTGSGKSLLVNSIVGTNVSRSGVIRPTTLGPVLVHHPDDAHWFSESRVLPGLARLTIGPGQVGGVDSAGDPHRELRLASSTKLPPGIALLDAPDIDSVDAANRALGAQLLGAADVWMFVTTAARYADAVPWGFLHQARERGTPLTLILNRVPPGALSEIQPHLGELLAKNGLADAKIFGVVEQTLEDSHLPAPAVAEIRAWLEHLGTDHEERAQTVRRSVSGTLLDLSKRSTVAADALDGQIAALNFLRNQAESPYEQAIELVRADINQGSVLRGEVLARWEEFVGTGELMRQLRTGIGRVRDRIASVLTGRPATTSALSGAVESVVETLIVTRADEAAAKAFEAWKASPAGSELLRDTAGSLDLGRASADLRERTALVVREWQGSLLDLVRNEGAGRRTTARVLSMGVNGVSAVLMMLVFSQTGGLTGGEVAIAGGASAVGHTILEALIGDDNLRRMAAEARKDLEARIRGLYESEEARYFAVLGTLRVPASGGTDVRSAAKSVSDELNTGQLRRTEK